METYLARARFGTLRGYGNVATGGSAPPRSVAAAERTVSGGHGGGETPVPIPNTAVKPARADGTWGEAPWESRSPPGFLIDEVPSELRLEGTLSFPGRVESHGCAHRVGSPQIGDAAHIDSRGCPRTPRGPAVAPRRRRARPAPAARCGRPRAHLGDSDCLHGSYRWLQRSDSPGLHHCDLRWPGGWGAVTRPDGLAVATARAFGRF